MAERQTRALLVLTSLPFSSSLPTLHPSPAGVPLPIQDGFSISFSPFFLTRTNYVTLSSDAVTWFVFFTHERIFNFETVCCV